MNLKFALCLCVALLVGHGFAIGQVDDVAKSACVLSGKEMHAGLSSAWAGMREDVVARIEIINNSKASDSVKAKMIKETREVVGKFDDLSGRKWLIPRLNIADIKKDQIGIPSGFSMDAIKNSLKVIHRGDEIKGITTVPLIDIDMSPAEIKVVKVIDPSKGICAFKSKMFIIRGFDMTDVADGDNITIERICVAEKTELWEGRKMWSIRCLSEKENRELIEHCENEAPKAD